MTPREKELLREQRDVGLLVLVQEAAAWGREVAALEPDAARARRQKQGRARGSSKGRAVAAARRADENAGLRERALGMRGRRPEMSNRALAHCLGIGRNRLARLLALPEKTGPGPDPD